MLNTVTIAENPLVSEKVLRMTESKEHKTCKKLVSMLTGCKTEIYIAPRRRADVACSEKLFFEVECRKEPSGKRICHIEPRIKIGEKEYTLGKLNCDKLEP